MTIDSTLADQSQVTQCPNCNMAFLISDEQLLVANGQVRCGSCLTIFQADQYWLTDADPTAPDSIAPDTSRNSNDAAGEAAATPPPNGQSQQHDTAASPDTDFEFSDSFLSINKPEAAPNSFEAYDSDDDDMVSNDEQWARDLLEEEEEEDPQEKKSPRNGLLSAILDQSAEEYDCSAAPAAMPQAHADSGELASDELESAEKWMQQALGQQPQDDDPGAPALPSGADHAGLLAQEPTEEYVPEIFRNTKQRSQTPTPEPATNQRTAITRLIESRCVRYCRSLSRAAWDRLRRLASMVAIGAALLTLIVQLTWSHSDQLHQQTALRPMLTAFCLLGGCILPTQAEPARVVQHNTIVYRAAHQQGLLSLQTELHNTSALASQYPRLRAELTDGQGRVIAARTFDRTEYLAAEAIAGTITAPAEGSPDGALSGNFSDQQLADAPSAQPTLSPGQTLQLSLQLVDPGAHAVNYRLRLMPQGH